MKKADLKISFALALFGFIAGFFVAQYQLENLSAEQIESIRESLPFLSDHLELFGALQLFLSSFILSFAGLKLARRTGLALPIVQSLAERKKAAVDRKGAIASVIFGLFTALCITGFDRFIFHPHLPMTEELYQDLSFSRLMAGIFYGGIFEEIFMRLFIMSLIVYLLSLLVIKKKKTIPPSIYWVAIIIAAVLFAAGHFPATQLFYGELTALLMFRSLLLNGLGGILFGWLYWKHGLEYGIVSHMIANVSVQLIFVPLFY